MSSKFLIGAHVRICGLKNRCEFNNKTGRVVETKADGDPSRYRLQLNSHESKYVNVKGQNLRLYNAKEETRLRRQELHFNT